MDYVDLIGTPLKSDILLDLFETYDVDVIYSYDRSHENMDDEYTAEIPEMGLGFIFDSSQHLATVFMKFVDHSGFNPFKGIDPRSVTFKSGVEAMEYAKERSIEAKHSEAKHDDFFGAIPEWVKFNFNSFSVHYQFQGGAVEMVTLQVQNA